MKTKENNINYLSRLYNVYISVFKLIATVTNRMKTKENNIFKPRNYLIGICLFGYLYLCALSLAIKFRQLQTG